MGNITALKKEMPMRSYRGFNMDDEASILFPELAFEVRKAWVTVQQSFRREELYRMNKVVGKHFSALEQVLELLHQKDHHLYAKTMEGYLTMKLHVLKGQLTRSKILHIYCEM
jgi:hypothetical protein